MCNSAQLSFSRKPQIPTPGDELLAVAPCGGSDEHITFIVPAELGTTPPLLETQSPALLYSE